MIIGITGYLGAGKDTVAEILMKKGFKHISLSDILREELRSRKKPVTRKNLQEIGNEFRERFGPGALAVRALLTIPENEDYIISSIGTVGEIEVLKKKKDFILIFVDAPQKTRWERIKKRKREQDPQTYKEFKKMEEKESKGGGKQYREFEKTRKLADIILINDKTKKILEEKVERMLKNIKNKRPSWDEYFLGVLEAVRQRGTCDRGKSGAIIVKNNRILTTGYVGAPVGLPHCDQVGHLFQEVINEDGTKSKHCIRTTHAEQNAIVQAARNGIAIEGATMYCSMEPCFTCAKLIINAGIKRVVAKKRYKKAELTREFFAKAGVKLEVIDDELPEYAKKEMEEQEKQQKKRKK